jgi:hypothetical protein
MTFLTPLGALTLLAVAVPLAAVAVAGRRLRTVRRVLALQAPRHGRELVAVAAIAAAFMLLALAAAQPAVSHTTTLHVRRDVQALFVLDTSRSMAAAAAAGAPTRLARAKSLAVRLRAAVPSVESGVATFTDRVLPDLLPVADAASFDATVERSVAIESPPPRSTALRATTFTALTQIPGSGFFAPAASRRIVVLVTDGESGPFDAGALGRALAHVRLLVVSVAGAHDRVFRPDGSPETHYRADPAAPSVLASLASATGGRVFTEADAGDAAARLRALAGTGPTTSATARERRETTLAPFVALAALLPLLVLVRLRSR